MAKKSKKNMSSSKFSIEELRSCLKIDQNNLDTEISQQPVLYDQVSESAAMSRSRLDHAKDSIETIEAEISVQIRSDAEKEDEKLTESGIKVMIIGDKDRKKAVATYLGLKHETELWDKLENSFRNRGYMLRELSSLFIAGYYQESSSSGSRGRLRKTHAEKNSERLAEKRRERKNKE